MLTFMGIRFAKGNLKGVTGLIDLAEIQPKLRLFQKFDHKKEQKPPKSKPILQILKKIS